MTDQTCKNCKHWLQISQHTTRNGVTSKVIVSNECRRMQHSYHMKRLDGRAALIMASADNDATTEAFLMTGPDFGCIHFQPEQQPQSEA